MRNSRIKRENMPAQNTRLPLIGRIRCGRKDVNKAGKEYPVSLDYFIATGSYAAKFDEVYDKPDRIQVVFISDDDFQSCYEEWDGRDKEGRRAGYGDGETYWLWDSAKNEYLPTQSRDEVLAYSKQHTVKWRQVLTINFVIPKIRGVFGVWQLQTGGDKSSINAIRNTFDEIKELAGTVVNIPFDLCVKKVTSNKPEAKSVYPVISLVPNISAENMEVLRGFYNAGLDMRHQGILSEQKLQELTAHQQPEVIKAEPTEAGEAVAELNDEPEKYVYQRNYQYDNEARVANLINSAKTVRELQEVYANEPSLFMEDENTDLNKLYTTVLTALAEHEKQKGG